MTSGDSAGQPTTPPPVRTTPPPLPSTYRARPPALPIAAIPISAGPPRVALPGPLIALAVGGLVIGLFSIMGNALISFELSSGLDSPTSEVVYAAPSKPIIVPPAPTVLPYDGDFVGVHGIKRPGRDAILKAVAGTANLSPARANLLRIFLADLGKLAFSKIDESSESAAITSLQSVGIQSSQLPYGSDGGGVLGPHVIRTNAGAILIVNDNVSFHKAGEQDSSPPASASAKLITDGTSFWRPALVVANELEDLRRRVGSDLNAMQAAVVAEHLRKGDSIRFDGQPPVDLKTVMSDGTLQLVYTHQHSPDWGRAAWITPDGREYETDPGVKTGGASAVTGRTQQTVPAAVTGFRIMTVLNLLTGFYLWIASGRILGELKSGTRTFERYARVKVVLGIVSAVVILSIGEIGNLAISSWVQTWTALATLLFTSLMWPVCILLVVRRHQHYVPGGVISSAAEVRRTAKQQWLLTEVRKPKVGIVAKLFVLLSIGVLATEVLIDHPPNSSRVLRNLGVSGALIGLAIGVTILWLRSGKVATSHLTTATRLVLAIAAVLFSNHVVTALSLPTSKPIAGSSVTPTLDDLKRDPRLESLRPAAKAFAALARKLKRQPPIPPEISRLAKTGDPLLVAMIVDDDNDLRFAAISVSWQLDKKRLGKPFIEALQDARGTLAEMVIAYKEAGSSVDRGVQFQAVELLGLLKPSSRQLLIRVTGEATETVISESAASALYREWGRPLNEDEQAEVVKQSARLLTEAASRKVAGQGKYALYSMLSNLHEDEEWRDVVTKHAFGSDAPLAQASVSEMLRWKRPANKLDLLKLAPKAADGDIARLAQIVYPSSNRENDDFLLQHFRSDDPVLKKGAARILGVPSYKSEYLVNALRSEKLSDEAPLRKVIGSKLKAGGPYALQELMRAAIAGSQAQRDEAIKSLSYIAESAPSESPPVTTSPQPTLIDQAGPSWRSAPSTIQSTITQIATPISYLRIARWTGVLLLLVSLWLVIRYLRANPKLSA